MGVAERERRVVEARGAAARRRLLRRLRRQLERRQRRDLADVLRHYLIERRGHAGPNGPLVRPMAAQPGGRGEPVHTTDQRLVLEVPERRDVFLVRLERLENGTELEVG